MSRIFYCALAAILLLWASAFVGIRTALHSYSPTHLALLRNLIASLVLVGFALWKKQRLPALRDSSAVPHPVAQSSVDASSPFRQFSPSCCWSKAGRKLSSGTRQQHLYQLGPTATRALASARPQQHAPKV